MSINWTTIHELHSLLKGDDWDRIIRLQDHILEQVANNQNAVEFWKTTLPEVAAEVGATWAAIIERTPEWITVAQTGRQPFAHLPGNELATSLDRSSCGKLLLAPPSSGQLVFCPFAAATKNPMVLCLYGRALPEDIPAYALAMAPLLGRVWAMLEVWGISRRRIDHLRATLKIASAISGLMETEPLLERIAREATRLLDCDRASIFVWDREHHEVIACPALGVDGGSLRLPDSAGIVGEVIRSGELLRVDDVYSDARFHQKVDQTSGYRTQNLMCGPLLDANQKMLGAFEVINKNGSPFNAEDEVTLRDLSLQVATALQNTRERETLLRSHRQLTEQAVRGVNIIGQSSATAALRGTIQRLAATDLPVLVLGESGSGKEVVAQSLHYQGPRTDRPFIAVNCAALTETLLESELFGHEKGSFTDAHEMRRGKFELAEGGTLFLDEIGDMSPGGQAKLLRVLEQKVITRVGGSQSISTNVRVVAATNANLPELVRGKKFREDLYFRLNVVTLVLPPLRDRPDDVLPLAEHFLQIFSLQARRPRLQLSAEARKRLQAHSWPGNVRELRNLMERVAFLAPGEKVEAEDLAFILSPDKDQGQDPTLNMHLSDATNVFQQEHIRRAIRRVRGNMTEAAQLMGLHRSNLYRKMRQLGMSEAGSEGDEE